MATAGAERGDVELPDVAADKVDQGPRRKFERSAPVYLREEIIARRPLVEVSNLGMDRRRIEPPLPPERRSSVGGPNSHRPLPRRGRLHSHNLHRIQHRYTCSLQGLPARAPLRSAPSGPWCWPSSESTIPIRSRARLPELWAASSWASKNDAEASKHAPAQAHPATRRYRLVSPSLLWAYSSPRSPGHPPAGTGRVTWTGAGGQRKLRS